MGERVHVPKVEVEDKADAKKMSEILNEEHKKATTMLEEALAELREKQNKISMMQEEARKLEAHIVEIQKLHKVLSEAVNAAAEAETR